MSDHVESLRYSDLRRPKLSGRRKPGPLPGRARRRQVARGQKLAERARLRCVRDRRLSRDYRLLIWATPIASTGEVGHTQLDDYGSERGQPANRADLKSGRGLDYHYRHDPGNVVKNVKATCAGAESDCDHQSN